MIECPHLILNPVLLVDKSSSQKGFPLFVGLLRCITPLHRHRLIKILMKRYRLQRLCLSTYRIAYSTQLLTKVRTLEMLAHV